MLLNVFLYSYRNHDVDGFVETYLVGRDGSIIRTVDEGDNLDTAGDGVSFVDADTAVDFLQDAPAGVDIADDAATDLDFVEDDESVDDSDEDGDDAAEKLTKG